MGFSVPRITVNFDFGKDSSFGELSLMSLGYGLHQAWIYSSMFDKSGIFGNSSLVPSLFSNNLSLAYFISILVYGVLLLVASALDKRLGRLFKSPVFLGIAAILGLVGTLLLLANDSMVQPLTSVTVVQIVSGVLTGAGSSVLLIAWGMAFAQNDSATIIVNAAISIAVGFGAYGLILHQIPFPAGAIASAIIPVIEVIILCILRSNFSRDIDNSELVFQPLPINHGRFIIRFGVPVFLLGMVLGILRQTSIESVLPAASFESQSILFITACCAMVIIMVTFLALGGDEQWHTFFKPLIPFIAITVLFMPFINSSGFDWPVIVVLTGYMSFEALMWIFFAVLSQRFRLSPIFVFGLGRGVMALAALGGSTLSIFMSALELYGIQFGFESRVNLLLLIIIVLFVAYVLLPNEREMKAITTIEYKDSPGSSSADKQTPDNFEESPSALMLCENCQAFLGASADDGGNNIPETCVRTNASASLMNPNNESTLQKHDPISDYQKRCETVSNTYLLSRREAEVLYYLARGYKSSAIQQQLTISEGTAKTHIRHIYRKLNIHSQQELIHLMESVE